MLNFFFKKLTIHDKPSFVHSASQVLHHFLSNKNEKWSTFSAEDADS